MKKTVLVVFAVLAMMTVACQNAGNDNATKEQEAIRQRVEQMMQLDADNDVEQLLTADLLALQRYTQGVHFQADYYSGFQWNLGVFDACTQEPKVTIEDIKPIDSLHCDVVMRYFDEGCYDEPYTLNLLKEDGEWKIDDVVFEDGSTMRSDCKRFRMYIGDTYKNEPAEQIMELLLQEEPLEEHYTDPQCIYYENPDAVRQLIVELHNCHELFKKNPGYTEDYGKQLDDMIARIKSHLE